MRKISILVLVICLAAIYGCSNIIRNEKENKNMKTKIHFIRNATMKITYEGKTLLTDPMLAEKATLNGFLYRDQLVNPTVKLSVDKEEILKDIDALLVSHTHVPEEDVPAPASDHFDPIAIETLDKSLTVFSQQYDEMGLKRLGFENVTSVNESLTWDNINITKVSGRHVDLDPLLPRLGESSGYILRGKNSPTIFWMGDTLLTADMKTIVKDNKPDIIIVHAGKAQLPIDAEGNKATLLMGAEETIEVSKLAPKAKVVAIHMEALDHCTVTRDDVRKAFEDAGIDESRYIIPADGEVIEL